MASDKKKSSVPSSGNGGSVPSTKRPARTIELEAEEVTVEVAPPEKETSPDAKTKDTGKKSEDKSDAGSETIREDDAAPDAASPAPSAQRTQPPEIKSFVTHLAAGLAGGLIGVIGAGFALDRLPGANNPAATSENTEMVKRLNAVEFRLDALPADDRTAELREAVGKLETRLASLENKPSEERPETADIAMRLGKLEGTLKTLREAGAQDGASGVAQSAALTGKIDEVSTALETQLARLKEDMAELKLAIETRVLAQARESGETASGLAERVGSFESKIAALENSLAETAAPVASLPASSGDGAALALAFENFRRAAERGQPYAEQLQALKALAPDGLDLTPFSANAKTGVETETGLLTALPGVLKAARSAIVKQESGTFIERVVSNARSVVRVRRIGPSDGDTPEAVLSRMEAQMKSLNLAGVLREAKGLKGSAGDAVQPWIDKAMARRETVDKLDALGRQLLSGLQAKTDEKR